MRSVIEQQTRMVDDPSEPVFVRELLQAGVDDKVTDYDYRKGLIKHLAIIAAGTLIPAWAKGLISSSSATKTIGGLSAKLIAFIVGLPVVTAGVITSVMLINGKPESHPNPPTKAITTHVWRNNPPKEPEISNSNVEPSPVAQDDSKEQEQGVFENSPEIKPFRHVHRARSPRSTHATPPTNNAILPPNPTVEPSTPTREPNRLKEDNFDFAPLLKSIQRSSAKPEKSGTENTPVIEKPKVTEQRNPEKSETPKAGVNPFQRETSMLASANRLLDSDPARALELAVRGEREFPGSMFTEERRHVWILALIKLDRVDEARRLAEPYFREYPNSPFAQRVRHALAKAQRRE
jgi:hypothetical protein